MNPTPPPKGGDYWEARTRREQFAAKLLELEYARQSGKVLDSDKVLALTMTAFSNVRTRLRRLGRSMAGVLQHRSASEIENLLNDAVDNALTALSDDVLRPADALPERDGPQPHPMPDASHGL